MKETFAERNGVDSIRARNRLRGAKAFSRVLAIENHHCLRRRNLSFERVRRVGAQQPPRKTAAPASRRRGAEAAGAGRGTAFPETSADRRPSTIEEATPLRHQLPPLSRRRLAAATSAVSTAPALSARPGGELIHPVVNQGRNNPGMPPMPPIPSLTLDDTKAIAAYIRSVLARSAGQGGPPPGPPIVLNIVVGNAAAGQKFFAANCASCHSPTGDLAGIASRYPEPMQCKHLGARAVAGGAAAARRPGASHYGWHAPTVSVSQAAAAHDTSRGLPLRRLAAHLPARLRQPEIESPIHSRP